MERSYVPRYVEIERSLRERIAGMQPGEKLPSDADLCQAFGVSRMTARHAVHALVLEGLVTRMPGRGTFVSRPPVRRHMGSLLSFTEEMRRRGLTPSSRVLSRALEPPTDLEITQLDLSSRARVVVLRRVRLANGMPMSIERAALRPELEGVLEEDLDHGSLHAAMRRLGCAPTLARGSLTVRLPTDEEIELLGITADTPLLVERRLISDQGGRPVELTESCYAGDRYVFDLELHAERAPISEPEPTA